MATYNDLSRPGVTSTFRGSSGSGNNAFSSSSSSSGGVASPELMALIAQLSGAASANNASRAERQKEIGKVRETRGDYGKDDAFADAQGLMAQQLAASMAAAMPGITRGAEGAGASQGAMRALLTQQAARNAAQDASALGAQQAVQYGGISNQASGVLEMLTRPDDSSLNALLGALQIQQRALAESQSQSQGNRNYAQPSAAQNNSAPRNQGIRAAQPAARPTVVGSSMPYQSSPSGSALPPGMSHIRSQSNYLGGLSGGGPIATDKDIIAQYTNLMNNTPALRQDAVRTTVGPNPLDYGFKF